MDIQNRMEGINRLKEVAKITSYRYCKKDKNDDAHEQMALEYDEDGVLLQHNDKRKSSCGAGQPKYIIRPEEVLHDFCFAAVVFCWSVQDVNRELLSRAV